MWSRLSSIAVAVLFAACRISPQRELDQANLLLNISGLSPQGKLLWVVAVDEENHRRDFAPILTGQNQLQIYITGLSPGRFALQAQVMNDLNVLQCFHHEATYVDRQIVVEAPLTKAHNGACATVPGCLPTLSKEELCNGLDDDCNGIADDGLPEKVIGLGVCQCRAPSCAGGKPAPDCIPGAPEPNERCNGRDDNCDGILPQNESDNDQDGFLTCAPCEQDASLQCGDCNNDSPSIAPGLPELCDGLDNDCNGLIEDGVTCP